MKGDFPRFRAVYQHDELVAHFLLQDAEREFIGEFRGDANRKGVAVLLKSLLYLGYFPDSLDQVPSTVRTFIAAQLNLLWDHTELYSWHSSTKDYHLSLIRKHLGWRFPTAQDKEDLERWLRDDGARAAHTEEDLLELARRSTAWFTDRTAGRERVAAHYECRIERLLSRPLFTY